MNVSKNNLLFLFSGGIIAVCLIATIILVGTKGKSNEQKQPQTSKERQNLSEEASNQLPAEDKTPKLQDEEAKYTIPSIKKVNFSDISENTKNKIASLSLQDKVAQLFLISPTALTGVENVTIAGETTKNAIHSYNVGGLIYDKSNLIDRLQIKTMLETSNSYSKENIQLPLFLAVKDNGGDKAAITGRSELGTGRYKNPLDLSSSSIEEAFLLGQSIGEELKEFGFNMNLAPSALLSEDSFSFGEDADSVSRKCLAFYTGLQSKNIYGVYTDFPGKYDDTSENSPSSDSDDLESLNSGSLIPYKEGLKNSSMLMLNNLAYPNLTASVAPAFMSHKMVNELIRKELSYKGLIITPALNTADPSGTFTDSEMAIMAIESGCDMIYEPKNFKETYAALLEAVENHRISEDRIDESLARILTVKEFLSLEE